MQNKDVEDWTFDWKKNSLIALAFSSGGALISSLFLMKKSNRDSSLLSPSNVSLKELGLDMSHKMDGGCSPCKMMKQDMRNPYKMLNLRNSPRKYKMHCGEM